MDGQTYVVIFITCADKEEGRLISRMLLEQRMVACVNIISGIESIYRWHGEINQTKESLLVVKTKQEMLAEVTALVKGMHSYEVPEIISMPINGGNDDYFNWIDSEVSGNVNE